MNFLRELLEDLVGDAFEDFVSPRVQGCLSDLGFKVLGLFSIAFWYSGFADCENYASRGYRIFFVPACGVVMAMLLYALVFHLDNRFDDSATWIVVKISGPFLIPLIIMFWLRERNAHDVMGLCVVFGCLLLVMILFFTVIDAEAWPWRRIALLFTLLVIVLAIGYAVRISAPKRSDAAMGRDKYAPLCLGK